MPRVSCLGGAWPSTSPASRCDPGHDPNRGDDFGRAVSRILSAPKLFEGENHLSQQPVPGTRSAVRNLERAAPGSPIWPCTRWGFPCLRACAWSGGLLPHLFTLTPPSLPRPRRFDFLWHYPSGRLTASPPACISPPAFLRRPRPVTRHRALWSSDFPPPPSRLGESDSPPFQNHIKYSRMVSRAGKPIRSQVAGLARPLRFPNRRHRTHPRKKVHSEMLFHCKPRDPV